ncbi:hypothetical protein C4K35_1905 [Pseudomonas chlororaphis subsp. piscium]|nr:hypothetical protein C4K35_1905 [Pseudomonas chlororaphis subsp. piscium]
MRYRKGVVTEVNPQGYVVLRYELNGNDRSICREGSEVIIPR